jgi:hypothetical protein
MGMYLNQLPPTEVARLKAELAETLIANFCYPRFYDYRVSTLRMRPVDRSKRQEVWQYLNAVDFNVWGRVDVDSPDFQRQVERLFIHFVQRNRNFFGEQGRRRMTDVRTLIASCSLTLAEGLRGHLRGRPEHPPFGSPRPVYSWSTANIAGHPEPPWEQILTNTMQLQQQLQEVRGEIHLAPVPSPVPGSSGQGSGALARTSAVPSRRPRPPRPTPNGLAQSNREEETKVWPSQKPKQVKPDETNVPAAFAGGQKENSQDLAEVSSRSAPADVAPTLPLPLGRQESLAAAFQSVAPSEVVPAPQRTRYSKLTEATPATPFVPPPPSGPLRRSLSQPLSHTNGIQQEQALQPVVSATSLRSTAEKQSESATALMSDEDVVIFEQLRHQLVIWLRVEAVRSGIDLSSQGAFQLIEVLRQQDGMDVARLQVISTLLNMSEQVISSGRATLFDYKQAMMFYLMHTRRTR